MRNATRRNLSSSLTSTVSAGSMEQFSMLKGAGRCLVFSDIPTKSHFSRNIVAVRLTQSIIDWAPGVFTIYFLPLFSKDRVPYCDKSPVWPLHRVLSGITVSDPPARMPEDVFREDPEINVMWSAGDGLTIQAVLYEIGTNRCFRPEEYFLSSAHGVDGVAIGVPSLDNIISEIKRA
ncbi:hypothetical protein RRG08_016909 [Elysia crispata]|uniref:Uncharacterized protein n=1 Tax=Elysia crispata TaxID=231223 RepID=A0AAE1DES1_9GAST|nr:hypothetical protein RRG08_016909 [Elysia crispata]